MDKIEQSGKSCVNISFFIISYDLTISYFGSLLLLTNLSLATRIFITFKDLFSKKL